MNTNGHEERPVVIDREGERFMPFPHLTPRYQRLAVKAVVGRMEGRGDGFSFRPVSRRRAPIFTAALLASMAPFGVPR